MRFRVERDEAELLDPRAGFERRRIPLEVRFDPLTGHTSRVLPHGSRSALPGCIGGRSNE